MKELYKLDKVFRPLEGFNLEQLLESPSGSRILAGGSKGSSDLSPVVDTPPPAFSIVLMSDEEQHWSQTCGRFSPWDDKVRIHKMLSFVT